MSATANEAVANAEVKAGKKNKKPPSLDLALPDLGRAQTGWRSLLTALRAGALRSIAATDRSFAPGIR
jgi:hypothetical protein